MTAKNPCANYYSADPTKDVLCEACGGKLWDAQKQLKYWFPIFKADYSGIRCVHCAYDYSNPWVWENLPDTFELGSIDIPYFDKQADSCGMCPPTVFKRYEARLAELPDSFSDLPGEERNTQAKSLFDEEMTTWRAERAQG